MRILSVFLTAASLLWISGTALAKTDLVTLPGRDAVQLTIYNAEDLTLVRDKRSLTMAKGENRLQFSWAGTLIDPTSLELRPGAQAQDIDIQSLSFPPRTDNLGVWRLHSKGARNAPMEISYLTSGLSWRAFYMGMLAKNEQAMHLRGYVRVVNNSGEDYENAQVRLLVGEINLVDRISDLARRKPPYGRPGGQPVPPPMPMVESRAMMTKQVFEAADAAMAGRRKEIAKEGLSEYFLYTIEGTETIPSGWSKRLLSFEAASVPVVNLYKFDEERFGAAVHRFLSFKNDKQHSLGDTPIPGGMLKVYKDIGSRGHRSYVGQSYFKYIPVDEDVELDLGPVDEVLVKPVLMDFATDRFLFDRHGNINGWDEIHSFKVEVTNTKAIPAKVEITRNMSTPHWELTPHGNYGRYTKKDLDTATFTLELKGGEKQAFTYVLTTHHGRRAE